MGSDRTSTCFHRKMASFQHRPEPPREHYDPLRRIAQVGAFSTYVLSSTFGKPRTGDCLVRRGIGKNLAPRNHGRGFLEQIDHDTNDKRRTKDGKVESRRESVHSSRGPSVLRRCTLWHFDHPPGRRLARPRLLSTRYTTIVALALTDSSLAFRTILNGVTRSSKPSAVSTDRAT